MKKFPLLLSLGVSAFFFACGDDSSSATNSETIADKSSSSEIVEAKPGSSESANNEDSHDNTQVEESSSSVASSSSSKEKNEVDSSSSEAENEVSSSSSIDEIEDESSSSVEEIDPMDSISTMLQKQLLAELGVKGNYPQYPGVEHIYEATWENRWKGDLTWYHFVSGFGEEEHYWYAFSKEPKIDVYNPLISNTEALRITIDAKPSVYYCFGVDLVDSAQISGANLSKFKQINLAYSSTTLPLDIVLVPEQNEALIGDDIYEINQGDNFRITLPATGDKISEVTLLFTDFAQEGWGVKQNLDDVIKALGAIQFAINGYKIDFKSEESISTDITIYGLGWE